MASTKEQQISTLFVELKKSSDEYDDERSLQLVNELLKYDSNNQLALHCKVVTLIRLDRYTDALSMIARQLKNTSLDLNYEKIYCYYRTNQLSQALELLDSAKKQNPEDPSLLYLEAQLVNRK
jgi:signal recognition particle subunit SRP72